MILGTRDPTLDDLKEKLFQELYEKAIDVFSLLHNRYIHSNEGLKAMI